MALCGGRPGRRSHVRRRERLVCGGRQAERLRSCERKDVAFDRRAAHAGTAFDGEHQFYQLAENRIQKVDAKTGRVLATIPAPAGGGDSGLAWAEGTLWVGHYRDRKIHQIDPETGKILRTIESNRFVTGVSWVDGELWHGTWEGEESDVRRIDPQTGEVLEKLEMPPGVVRVRARVRWWRSVLLWWREEWEGAGSCAARGLGRVRQPVHRERAAENLLSRPAALFPVGACGSRFGLRPDAPGEAREMTTSFVYSDCGQKKPRYAQIHVEVVPS